MFALFLGRQLARQQLRRFARAYGLFDSDQFDASDLFEEAQGSKLFKEIQARVDGALIHCAELLVGSNVWRKAFADDWRDAAAIGVCWAACTAMVALAVAIMLSPELPCRSICVKDHTELRAIMRPDFTGAGGLSSDVLAISVCEEYQEVCPPDAAAAPVDMLVPAGRAEMLDDDEMAERIKRAAQRDDARSVERRCGKNVGADASSAPRYPHPGATSPEIGGNPL